MWYLQDAIEEKIVAFNQAKASCRRLRYVFGLSEEGLVASTVGQHRRKRAVNNCSPLISVPTFRSSDALAEPSSTSGASSEGGPTPKRTKPRISAVEPIALPSHGDSNQNTQHADQERKTMRAQQCLHDSPSTDNARMSCQTDSARSLLMKR